VERLREPLRSQRPGAEQIIEGRVQSAETSSVSLTSTAMTLVTTCPTYDAAG
jgi:hypothetical protein